MISRVPVTVLSKFYHLVVIIGLADRFEEYPKLRELIRLKVRFCKSTCLFTDWKVLTSRLNFIVLLALTSMVLTLLFFLRMRSLQRELLLQCKCLKITICELDSSENVVYNINRIFPIHHFPYYFPLHVLYLFSRKCELKIRYLFV